MVTPIDWAGSVTLEQHILRMFEEGKTETPEFKTYVALYGEAKIAAMWEAYQAKRKVRASSDTFRTLTGHDG